MSKKSRKEQKQRQQMKMIIIIIVAVLVVLAAILIGVAAANNAGGHDHEHEVTLKVALAANEGDTHYKAVQKFKEEVESTSHGTVHVEIHGSGKLGNNKTLIGMFGQEKAPADIVVADVADFTDVDARMDISGLPFLFESHQDAYNFVDGDIQKKVEESLVEKNVRVLAHYSDGFEHITTKKNMVTDAQGLKDLNFAVTKESYSDGVIRSFQARTTLVEPAKLQNALGQGSCDGYIGTLDSILNDNIYQTQNSLSVAYYSYHAMAFAISETVWKELSEEQQQAVSVAAMKSAQTDRSMIEQSEFNALKRIESSGVRVVYPSLKSFESAASSSYTNFRSRYGELIDEAIMEMRK